MTLKSKGQEESLFTPTRHGFLLPPPGKSVSDVLGELPIEAQREILGAFEAKELEDLENDWRFIARREQLPPLGDWRIFLMCAGRGVGKQLCLETPIRTTKRWKTIGTLEVGDQVFDENGNPCTVKKLHPISESQEAYRLHFTGGSTLDACADHLWVTWTHRDRKQYQSYQEKLTEFPERWDNFSGNLYDSLGRLTGTYGPRIRTTKEIFDTQKIGVRGDSNHCIPIARALRMPERTLEIDPWLLGYWLGNGTSKAAELHSGSYQGNFDDSFVCGKLDGLGYKYKSTQVPEKGHHRISIMKFLFQLKGLNLIGNKHIPIEYLQGSVPQRKALVQGLMDSDGHCPGEASNQVEFCSTTEGLALGMEELVLSLGERCSLKEGRASLNGKDCGPKYRVCWRPTQFNPFSLPRKKNRLENPKAQALRTRHRMIIKVERISSRPMRCITVSSPSGLFLAGRELIPTHNTRMGAEYLTHRQKKGLDEYSAIIAPTTNDLWGVCVEGESGIMAIAPNGFRPTPKKQSRQLEWPNGAKTNLFSAEEPERLRGPQHSFIWGDELVAWSQHSDPKESDRKLEYLWSMARFGLRLIPKGGVPEMLLTTTPKPRKLIKLLVDCASGKSTKYNVAISTGSTYANAKNLSPEFIEDIRAQYEGTRLGEQELHGKILEDMGGDLWTPEIIDANRVKNAPEMQRIIIAVDPATTSEEGSDLTGIVAVGLGEDGFSYVLGDHSKKGSPDQWAKKVADMYDFYEADKVVAEKNQGGDMVETTLRTKSKHLPIKLVHASRGKYVRAEPVAALYEQGKVKHVGEFVALEDEMCRMEQGRMKKSPDRADALVYAITELMLEKKGRIRAIGNKKH